MVFKWADSSLEAVSPALVGVVQRHRVNAAGQIVQRTSGLADIQGVVLAIGHIAEVRIHQIVFYRIKPCFDDSFVNRGLILERAFDQVGEGGVGQRQKLGLLSHQTDRGLPVWPCGFEHRIENRQKNLTKQAKHTELMVTKPCSGLTAPWAMMAGVSVLSECRSEAMITLLRFLKTAITLSGSNFGSTGRSCRKVRVSQSLGSIQPVSVRACLARWLMIPA